MSLQALIKKQYVAFLNNPDDFGELDLDNIGTIPSLQPSDRDYLEKFEGISSLCMSRIGLRSLENWPKLNGVYLLNLSTNRLSTGLGEVARSMPHIAELELEYNNFADISELAELRNLPLLVSVTLQGNPVAALPNYRQALFSLLPNLRTIDDYDRDGNDCFQTLIEHEGDEMMDESVAKLESEIYGESADEEMCTLEEIDEDGTIFINK
eukprot:TRINITY_DN11205_c0_g2_i6.p1 TRINITY_DN11205_c0_g2~~TRINITY_DN11205_c0_g2_i6.p1  ORF type:complete len:210 (-),score=39.13 TRINITY_DN11205_c0_g2_i6:185-814(-)